MSSEDASTPNRSSTAEDDASSVGIGDANDADDAKDVDDPNDADAANDADANDAVVVTSDGVAAPTASENPEADGFGRAGWLLVGAVIFCFVLVPGAIYVYPYALGSFGLTFFGTYLLLPLVPAVLLGFVAVWTMSAAT